MTNNTIDTDAGIGTILSHFSSEYVNHVVQDSLSMRFRPFIQYPMPNMVDVLERQFFVIGEHTKDYKENVSDVRVETFEEIIQIICKYYNLEFTGDFDSMSPEDVHGVARAMYDIFISQFTDYMISFFVSFIINNADDIVSYLKNDPSAVKPKENGLYTSANYIDSKFILIHANINQVIYNMAAYDIPLQTLLNYFDPLLATSLGSLLADRGDIYKNYYASYILDSRYSASVLTEIKLRLQAETKRITQL